MEDTTRLKVILVGLFLAALALGYFIFSQRKSSNENFQVQRPIQQMEIIPEASPSATISPTATPSTLGQTTESTTKGGQPLPSTGVSTLPATGVPSMLVGILGASAALAGWKLRRFSFKI